MAKKTTGKTACFSKEQFLTSECFKKNKDLIHALLADDKTYSLEEVNAMIQKFMKGKVNETWD